MHRLLLVTALVCLAGCSGGAADDFGIGAQCTANDQCDGTSNQTCLAQFKGGYCGLEGCAHDSDCPTDSACIVHADAHNYCFRTCASKADCNANRDAVNEANCSATATFIDPVAGRKACVPPSGG